MPPRETWRRRASTAQWPSAPRPPPVLIRLASASCGPRRTRPPRPPQATRTCSASRFRNRSRNHRRLRRAVTRSTPPRRRVAGQPTRAGRRNSWPSITVNSAPASNTMPPPAHRTPPHTERPRPPRARGPSRRRGPIHAKYADVNLRENLGSAGCPAEVLGAYGGMSRSLVHDTSSSPTVGRRRGGRLGDRWNSDHRRSLRPADGPRPGHPADPRFSRRFTSAYLAWIGPRRGSGAPGAEAGGAFGVRGRSVCGGGIVFDAGAELRDRGP